ncbi:MAG: IS3 family transposase [Gammaproteobacteria bacterium]|nr:IS3 family transposase [Gammaproteobacteria bacterium]
MYRHKGRYGYRRITLSLRNLGMVINHKKSSETDAGIRPKIKSSAKTLQLLRRTRREISQ